MNAIVTYFVGESHEEDQFLKIECVVTQDVVEVMLKNNPPQFIQVLINDGERMILRVDNINNIQQVI